ncbi:MAG TPA: polyribonucleotide nucleotidyltransferase [Myxococcota bacterium]|jgi:polyribonucleotide nucleotidyltransferase|nr:polyribonucleotide nucleotidyltransferase [Myxococcota bacterium]
MIIRESVDVGGRDLTIETGRLAKQAGGSALLQQGDSLVLVTVCASPDVRPGQDFFPLTVDYIEKTYAAGMIPGGFFKREGRLSEREILTCRVIDRPIRPLFPEGYRNEVQVTATVLSHDRENQTDVLALTGASTALMLSEIPFDGPIAGVRVARIDGKFVANPTFPQLPKSDLELVVAASEQAIVMVEGGAAGVAESVIVDALLFAHDAVRPVLALQRRLREAAGKPKLAFTPPQPDQALAARVWEVGRARLAEAVDTNEKMARYGKYSKYKKEVVAELVGEYPGREPEIKAAWEEHKYKYVRERIVKEGRRIGGRGPRDIRNITCEVGVLPRTHGSGLFTRGETQVVSATTLGTSSDQQRVDALTGDLFKRFMLHYNFPPFSVGEVKPLRGPGRREIGHGNLAWRAIEPVLPGEDVFPYTIRLVAETLESNGSSSMATVCSSILSLMDAGVPIKAPVAGIAMGLIQEGDDVAILSDILGDEDHLGDMDFKVCGTRDGVTAIQMDIKVQGLSRELLEKALYQAREARLHVLERMLAVLPEARKELSPHAPRITTLKIKTDRIRDVIGPGGKTIRGIVEATGCKVDVEDDGTILIASVDEEAAKKAIKMIKGLTAEPEVGRLYVGNVRKIAEFGAFVEILPGTDGLLHISEMSDKRVNKVTDLLQEGDEVVVKVLSVDRMGKIRLSRKEAMGKTREDVASQDQ